jgi:TetR/AcrR family transcriptional repressor of nem operon
MGRTRSFEEAEVTRRAAVLFLAGGYEGTSVDELVAATGVHRGSLYAAFGSKLGLFVAALRAAVTDRPRETATTDLVLVALLELAPRDRVVRRVVADHLDARRLTPTDLGARLLARARIPHRTGEPS